MQVWLIHDILIVSAEVVPKKRRSGGGYCLLIKYFEVLALGGAHFTTKSRKYGLKSGGSAVSKGGITRPRKMPVVR